MAGTDPVPNGEGRATVAREVETFMSGQSVETQLALIRAAAATHEDLDAARWAKLERSMSWLTKSAIGVIFAIIAWLAIQLYTTQQNEIAAIRLTAQANANTLEGQTTKATKP